MSPNVPVEERHRRAAASAAAPGSQVVANWVTTGRWRGAPGYGFYYRSKELETLAAAIAEAELRGELRGLRRVVEWLEDHEPTIAESMTYARIAEIEAQLNGWEGA